MSANNLPSAHGSYLPFLLVLLATAANAAASPPPPRRKLSRFDADRFNLDVPVTTESINTTLPASLLGLAGAVDNSACYGSFTYIHQLGLELQQNATLMGAAEAAALAAQVLDNNPTADCYFDLVRHYTTKFTEEAQASLAEFSLPASNIVQQQPDEGSPLQQPGAPNVASMSSSFIPADFSNMEMAALMMFTERDLVESPEEYEAMDDLLLESTYNETHDLLLNLSNTQLPERSPLVVVPEEKDDDELDPPALAASSLNSVLKVMQGHRNILQQDHHDFSARLDTLSHGNEESETDFGDRDLSPAIQDPTDGANHLRHDTQHHRQLGNAKACYGSVINVIAEALSFFLCLIGLGPALGRVVGKTIAKKLKSSALNAAKDDVQAMGPVTVFKSAETISSIAFKGIANIGFGGFMQAIFDNTKWYEWALIILVIAAQLVAIIASGGTAAVALLVAKLGTGALFGIAVSEVVNDCDGVGAIGCNNFDGFDFYEDLNSDGGNIIFSNRELHEIAQVCRDSRACKGFNTDFWVKTIIRPYDEWERGTLTRSGCKGIFVKPTVDICENEIIGYKFYDAFDSPDHTIASFPSKIYKDLAADCDARGSACQGFNSEGDLKSIIQTTPHWTRPENKCQGLYVKQPRNVCPEAAGYTFYNGRDFLSSNLTNLPDDGGFIDNMQAACDAEPTGACKGFTTYGSLKSEIDSARDWSPMPLLCYGVYVRDDIAVTCDDLEGYEYYANRDSNGNDIQRMIDASVTEMATECDSDNTCEGFNTDKWLKHTIKNKRFWRSGGHVGGLCGGMYIKKGVINPPAPYCTGGPDDIGCISCRGTTCRGVHVGRTKLVWKTVAVTGWGFIDDSYRIIATQDGVEVYDSGEIFRRATGGSSELLGNANGGDYRVEFKCENSFWWCEGGTLEFKMVNCECDGGVPPLLECDAESIETARDAICPATAPPTPVPTMVPTTLVPTIKPTRFPTEPPTPAPTAPAPPVLNGCFSGSVQVEVRDKGTMMMSDVRVGDQVRTPNGFESVYMFGHVDPRAPTEFFRVEFGEESSAAVELTGDHLLFIKTGMTETRAMPASSLQVGQELWNMGDPAIESNKTITTSAIITKIDRVTRSGYYAPFTKHGTLVIRGGVVASQYITAQPHHDTLQIGGMDTGLSWHDIVHVFQAGPRLYHDYIISPMSSTDTEDKTPSYMEFFNSLRWIVMEKDNQATQYVLLPLLAWPILVVGGSLRALECFLDNYYVSSSDTIDRHQDEKLLAAGSIVLTDGAQTIS